MINNIAKTNNTDMLKAQLINMVNDSGKIANKEISSSELRPEEKNAEYEERESKKQLESELRDLSKKLNDKMKHIGTILKFSYDENIPGLMVTIKESDSHKIIREIPSKEAIELMKRMREVIGIIFDKQG